jgi:hypothetical protein
MQARESCASTIQQTLSHLRTRMLEGIPAQRTAAPSPNRSEQAMAKGQKKSNKEVRKPKAAKAKPLAGLAVDKPGAVKGLENMRNS